MSAADRPDWQGVASDLGFVVPPELAWRQFAADIWNEQLRRRLRDDPEREAQLVRSVHEALALVDGNRWTEAADMRAREAFAEAGEAVGIGAPPWMS
jgi:hypothetical protein